MNVTKLELKKKGLILLLSLAITLTGCGKDKTVTHKEDYEKAMIIGNNTVTILEIEKCEFSAYNESMAIYLKDGSTIIVSSSDTKIITDLSNAEIEELAKDIMGEDVKINYYEVEPEKEKVKNKK